MTEAELQDDALATQDQLASSLAPSWTNTVDRVKPAVVALRVTTLRAFGGDEAGLARATGFVVHPGIILTNRHVLGSSGPITANAVFDQHEEIEMRPLYRDPIHDFGFFSFDPSRLRFTKQAIIPLRPDKLQVGVDIRVVGNDNGEKLQIMSGTIARVDRNVPEYGMSLYQDENTFYVGAASNTSAGSSGSPVITLDGDCVALNAGGTLLAATAFYVPLDRVARALKCLLQQSPIPRGSLQAAFLYRPFDYVRRSGFPEAEEQKMVAQWQNARGVLVVNTVMVNGVSTGKLLPGDVLLEMNGKRCIAFPEFEEVLDDNVGKDITVRVWRHDQAETLTINVSDLHKITPRAFVEVGEGVFHNVPYCYGKLWNTSLDGIFVAARGFTFGKELQAHNIILQIDGQDTPDVETFARIMATIPDKKRFTVLTQVCNHYERTKKMNVCIMEKSLTGPLRFWRLENAAHLPDHWVKEPALSADTCNASADNVVASECTNDDNEEGHCDKEVGWTVQKLPHWATAVLPSLVMIEFRTPCTNGIIDHALWDTINGVGVIVCTTGDTVVVLTDREAIPQPIGVIQLTLGRNTKVEARPLFIHPLHNLAVVGFAKSLVPGVAFEAISVHDAEIGPGETCFFAGLTEECEVISQEVAVLSSFSPNYRPIVPPAWREKNIEALLVSEELSGALGGVLCDSEGKVYALYAQFAYQNDQRGRDIEMAAIPLIGYANWMWPEPPTQVPFLGVELKEVSLADARSDRGLTSNWSRRLRNVARAKFQALAVHKIEPHSCSDGVLKEGDILLSVNKRVCCSPLDVERALHRWMEASEDHEKKVELCVFRQKKEINIHIRPLLLPSDGAEDVVIWNGMVLIRAPRAVNERGVFNLPPEGGVYCVKTSNGSPAGTYEIGCNFMLLKVNDVAIPCLDALVDLISSRSKEVHEPDEPAVWLRLLTKDLEGREQLKTLLPNETFYPPVRIARGPNGTFVRRPL